MMANCFPSKCMKSLHTNWNGYAGVGGSTDGSNAWLGAVLSQDEHLDLLSRMSAAMFGQYTVSWALKIIEEDPW